ncbi:MAG: right-handed parallel beta-helix repeat-containing protein [bacterium]
MKILKRKKKVVYKLIMILSWVILANVSNSIASVTVYNLGGSISTYTTIQAGINTCQSGATVTVSPGNYNEIIYINKAINLVGIGTPTIDASSFINTNTITFEGTATKNAVISGFIITGASYKDINWVYGNGISCINGAQPTITDNIIARNSSGGVICVNSFPIITNNKIIQNSYYGIRCWESSATITNNIIARSVNGLFFANNSSSILTKNIIIGNFGGVYCSNSPSTITSNVIVRNRFDGICCNRSPSIIANNVIVENARAGIRCESSLSVITNNTIEGNGHGIYCQDSSPTITNNIITQNGTTSPDCYGIYNDPDYPGTLTIDYNCMWGNGKSGNNNYYKCSLGVNDIQKDPQFIEVDDHHLKSTSPCIDAGTDTTVPFWLNAELDGNPRIVRRVDIGAYEYQSPPPPAQRRKEDHLGVRP